MFKDKGTNMDLHYKFNQEIYDPESIKGKYRMKKFLRIFAEYLKGLKGKALDVGCGNGLGG
jgi:hypothetical protein